MMERINAADAQSLPELQRLLPGVQHRNIVIEIKKTPLEEINEAIRMLKREKRMRYTCGIPLTLSTLMAMLSAAGVVYSIIKLATFDSNSYYTDPNLLNSYKNVTGSSDINGTQVSSSCGESYPVFKICDLSVFGSDNITVIDLFNTCYDAAAIMCSNAEASQSDTLYLFVCGIALGAISVAILACCTLDFTACLKGNHRDQCILTHDSWTETAEKYSVPVSRSVEQTITAFQEKAVEVSKASRITAFLSCGVDYKDNKDTSTIYSFFKGRQLPNGNINALHPDIQRKILYHAGLYGT